MPFDGVDFPPRREPPSRAPSREERVFLFLFVVVSVCLLVMPISAAALVDIVHYARAR